MRILHFIDSLNFGGAETLLMSYIPLLPADEHFVVTLSGPNAYERTNYQYIELNTRPVKDFFKARSAVRKIIADKKIDIVHAHSFWTNIISRFATSRKVKLINHYHFADYDTMKHKGSVKKMIMLDRITGRASLTRVAVSEYVAKILNTRFPKSSVEIIPNFIQCNGYLRAGQERGPVVRVIAVGNCNIEKNYSLVLRAFAQLKDEPVTLDIIGGGHRLESYQAEAERMGLKKLRFCGNLPNAKEQLKNYDLFLSASISETFGIAVLEGVCARLPLLISELPAFREIAPAGTVFFNPRDENDLVTHLRVILRDRPRIDSADYERILNKYSCPSFMLQLKKLYNS